MSKLLRISDSNILLLSKHRSFIFGVAIIMIVFFHSAFTSDIRIFAFAKEFLYMGVDIFVLLSGFGLYKSLCKNDLNTFYSNRAKRVLIPYIPFISVFIIFKIITQGFSFSVLIGNLTLMGWYVGAPDQFNWYVQALLVFYILSPTFKAIIQKAKFYTYGLLILTLILISFNFFNSDLLLLFTRIPTFAIGMILSKYLSENKNIPLWKFFIPAIIGAAILLVSIKIAPTLLWDYGLYWYPMILIAPFACILISAISEILKKYLSFVYKAVSVTGKYSFEIYIAHIFIFEVFNDFFKTNAILSLSSVLIGIFTGCIYGKIIKEIQKKLRKNHEKKTC